jgi:hypothetical protein
MLIIIVSAAGRDWPILIETISVVCCFGLKHYSGRPALRRPSVSPSTMSGRANADRRFMRGVIRKVGSSSRRRRATKFASSVRPAMASGPRWKAQSELKRGLACAALAQKAEASS